jgi:uncharacterized protein involved in exopolysaccharide biosynthesis
VTDAGGAPKLRRGDGVTLVALAGSILRHRRVITATAVSLFVIVVAWTLAQPRTYTSRSWFIPSSDQGVTSQLAGVAAQFGIAVPSGQSGASPQFYADLLTSHQLMGATVDTRFRFREAPQAPDSGALRQGTLIDLFRIGGARPAAVRRELAIRRLLRRVVAISDAEAGMVRVSVTTRWAQLSQQVLQRMLELVNEFNSRDLRSQAQAERGFIGARLSEAQADLRQTEGRMEQFLERNRDYHNSPQLVFAQARLQRELDVRQSVVMTLSQSYEQSKIQEVRDTPVITVVQQADLPPLPDPRHLILKGLLAVVVGTMLGSATAIGIELLSRSRTEEPDEYEALVALQRAAADDVRRLLRAASAPARAIRRHGADAGES